MNVNANLMRLYGLIGTSVLVLGLSACGGMVPVTSDSGMGTETVQSDPADLDNVALNNEAPLGDSSQSTAQTLLEPMDGSIGLTLVSSDSYNRIIVDGAASAVDFRAVRLAEPEQLVVTLPNQPNPVPREISVQGASTLSMVRLDSSDADTKLVIDINDGVAINHDVAQVEGKLVISLASDDNMQAALADMNGIGATMLAMTDDVEPMAQPKLADEDLVEAATTDSKELEVTDPIVPVADSTDTEAKFETATLDQPLKPLPQSPTLMSLKLEQTGPSANQVVAEMGAAGFYTFKKTASSEYVLTLEGAELAPEAAQTIIAGKGHGLIRSVRPVKQGNDVLLRVFAEPQALLSVKAKGTNLIIAPTTGAQEFDDLSEVMAQADVTEAEEAGDDAKVEVSDDDAGAEIDIDQLTEEILGSEDQYTGRLISLDLQDTDIDNALRIIAEVSNLNIIASDDVTGKVTLRLIDVPWDQALDVILKTNGLDKVQEGNVIRIAPVEKLRAERELLRQARQAEEELESLKVQYIRVSYAKAADLQPLVETVLTERGTVAFDERTNQLIVKDITKGLKNVARLVRKLDLRTPQVLIETQIIEANRNFSRSLGTELGFFFIRSPETGNALPYNFPNSFSLGGSASGDDSYTPGPGTISGFPSPGASNSAVSLLFGSADGTKNLDVRLSQLEREGRVKVVSRPSVAVTNNAPAVIKSVEKIRIKLPSGGVSVATGQGASASGGSSVATEVVEIGIVLNVTAQASPDYYVLLDINAKSSTLGNPSRGVDLIPPEIERSANSTVLVSSGQTFAMGGIYKISESDSVSGIPWLKDIPFLGHLFRTTEVTDSDEELIFFITPRIIEGSFDDAAMKGFAS